MAAEIRRTVVECTGVSEENGTMMVLAIVAVGSVLSAFAFRSVLVSLDRNPFLYNGGKMGKLEAQSIYTNKSC